MCPHTLGGLCLNHSHHPHNTFSDPSFRVQIPGGTVRALTWERCNFLIVASFFLGKHPPSKTDEFSEKLRRGGVISNPKIYVAKFGLLNRAFLA